MFKPNISNLGSIIGVTAAIILIADIAFGVVAEHGSFAFAPFAFALMSAWIAAIAIGAALALATDARAHNENTSTAQRAKGVAILFLSSLSGAGVFFVMFWLFEL